MNPTRLVVATGLLLIAFAGAVPSTSAGPGVCPDELEGVCRIANEQCGWVLGNPVINGLQPGRKCDVY